MQVSLKWINELVDIRTITLDQLIEKLTLGGFEVEEIIKVAVDNKVETALDISSTANRSDSLSIQGISTEISTLVNQSPTISKYKDPSQTWKEQIQTRIEKTESHDYYSNFIAVTVHNVQKIQSPKWVKQKLIACGITPVNNFLDFQNYILLETGYPFLVYDYDKVIAATQSRNFSLSFKFSDESQEFVASNEEKYTLNNSNLLVQANDIPISIAGIIEAKQFAYTPETKTLLIEGSIFNAAKIRQQSRMLGIRTDRSARYEKALKSTFLIESFYRFISLLRVTNPNLDCQLHTAIQTNELPISPILLRYQKINEILGPIKESNEEGLQYISPELIHDYLTRLKCQYNYNSTQGEWEIQIPHSRTDDLTREIDLIEEIGRLHGFNNFLTNLPKIQKIGQKDWSYQTRNKITTCLLNLGFNELIHYSLVNERSLVKNEVSIVNPLTSEYGALRASLLPSLLKSIQENLKQGNEFLDGFEYGHVFSLDQSKKFTEFETVAGIFGGSKTKSNWSDIDKNLSWFEAKGKLEQFLLELNVSNYWKVTSDSWANEIFHPYRRATLVLSNGKDLGIFGQIHPKLANSLDLSKNLYLFELKLNSIQSELQTNQITNYQTYSTYPKIIKDLSFIIDQKISFEDIQQLLYWNGTKFLLDIKLLDEYRGANIPPHQTSLCLQLIFQSSETTLQNKKIDTILENLQSVLRKEWNVLIRE